MRSGARPATRATTAARPPRCGGATSACSRTATARRRCRTRPPRRRRTPGRPPMRLRAPPSMAPSPPSSPSTSGKAAADCLHASGHTSCPPVTCYCSAEEAQLHAQLDRKHLCLCRAAHSLLPCGMSAIMLVGVVRCLYQCTDTCVDSRADQVHQDHRALVFSAGSTSMRRRRVCERRWRP